MASVKLKFRPSAVPNRKGSLYYQIIHRGKVKHIASDCRIYAYEWNALIQAEKGSRLAMVKETVEKDLGRLRDIVHRLDQISVLYTVEDVATAYRCERDECSLCAFVQSLALSFRNIGKARLSETYMSALSSFIRFRQGLDISLRDISQTLMKDYQDWMKRHGLSMNTVSFYLRVLRAVYNRAVEKGLTDQKYPFKTVYTGVARTVKRAVSKRVIKTIRCMHLPEGSSIGFSRDIFMFSFYTRGMSFVDIAYLKKTDIKRGVLSYRRRKTGQILSIRWEQCMQDIVDRYSYNMEPGSVYLLPIITKQGCDERKQYRSSLFRINQKLKEIGCLIGIEHPLTMYVARHSWASIARNCEVPVRLISEGLGHDSEKTTNN